MYNDVIKLISEDKSVDDYGDIITQRTERAVFVDVRSIAQAEFYQAQASGFKPEIKFVLPDFLEYKGETRLKYTPFGETEQEYKVIRLYRNDNELELTCARGVDK